MRFVGLISGGKDSIYSVCKLLDEGHNLVGALYMYSEVETVDSFMFQTVGKEIVERYSECLAVPLFVQKTKCMALSKGLEYEISDCDEVEDLYEGIRKVRGVLHFDAVSSGAILSRYQRNRIENVCKRLNIYSLTPLFGASQRELLVEMIRYGIRAVVVKVAGIDKGVLGADLRSVERACDASAFADVNYCGEGGEYETMVLDAPHFVKRVEIVSAAVRGHPEEVGKSGSVFFLEIGGTRVLEKAAGRQ